LVSIEPVKEGEVLNIWIAMVLGLIFGHVLRRLTPTFLRMKDRQLPFKLAWLEVLTGAGMGFLAWRFPELTGFIHWALFLIFLVAITATDSYAKLIPPELTWLGTLVGVVCSLVWPASIVGFLDQGEFLFRFGFPMEPDSVAGLMASLVGAAAGGVLMELIRRIFGSLVSMEVMGFGDTLIMIMIGAFLGPKMVIFCLFPACLIGVGIGMVHRVLYDVPHTPFGPALAGGAFLTLIYHPFMLRAIGGYQTMLRNLSGGVLVVFSLVLLMIAFYLVWRIRVKRIEYERQIEEDYQNIEDKIQR